MRSGLLARGVKVAFFDTDTVTGKWSRTCRCVSEQSGYFEGMLSAHLAPQLRAIMTRFLLSILLLIPSIGLAQETEQQPGIDTDLLAGALKFRNIGPAFMSGRIGDLAVDPENPNTWYVAVASGGLWKTTNAGTTFKPIFDDKPSYSMGCVSLDPSNPATVWLGTGENNGGRHIGFGDGVYVSHDGGATWHHRGLEHSEHVSKVLVDPRDSDVVFAACQGPLWSTGGQRGLFKSTDAGETWTNVLSAGGSGADRR